MVVEKEKFLNLLDKFIDRSERWIRDANDREDHNDVFYYKGQKDVIEELKDMAKNWSKGNDYAYDIKPLKDKFIKNDSLIYPTKEYYELLEKHFKKNGVELTFNENKMSEILKPFKNVEGKCLLSAETNEYENMIYLQFEDCRIEIRMKMDEAGDVDLVSKIVV